MIGRAEKLRILFVTAYYKPAYVYGGPVGSIAALCEALVDRGEEVAVYTTNANGNSCLAVPTGQQVSVDGVNVWYFPRRKYDAGFYYSPQLSRELKRNVSQFDVVIANAFWGHGNLVVSRVCQKYRVPYVIPIHGQLTPWALHHKGLKKQLYLRLIGRSILNHAAALQCTDLVEARLVEKLNLTPPMLVIPWGIDSQRFEDRKISWSMRAQLGIPESSIVLLFLGRLTRIKRPDIVIYSTAAALKQGLDVHLVLIGPDEAQLRDELIRYSESLGCADRVHFTGLLTADRVASALFQADLLLMPTEIQENFGMSALEALAAGVPLLTSPGVPVGLIAEKKGAGRVAQSTPESFSQAAVEMLSNFSVLRNMGERGRELSRTEYETSIVAGKMSDQLRSIVFNR